MFAAVRNLKNLTGAELLLLRLTAGPSLAAEIARELDRRAVRLWRRGVLGRAAGAARSNRRRVA